MTMTKMEAYINTLSIAEKRALRETVMQLIPPPNEQDDGTLMSRFVHDPWWRGFVNHPSWQELVAYIGLMNFRFERINTDDAMVDDAYRQYPDASTFYRETDAYLYHLLGFWLVGVKRPYLGMLFQAYQRQPFNLIDYGCGIGCDGIWLLDAGVNVSFADIPSRSLDFLRYRLLRRGYQEQRVYELPRDLAQIPTHDVAWCIDVLEHLPPTMHQLLLETLAEKGDTVFCSIVQDAHADGQVHHPVDMDGLTRYVADRWPMQYQDFPGGDGVVRLLIYGPQVHGKVIL